MQGKSERENIDSIMQRGKYGKKNIFKVLDKMNITYAVGVDYGALGFRAYFILISKKHPSNRAEITRLKFIENDRDDTLDRDMSEKEIELFNEMKHQFKVVYSDDTGTIYEQKGKSLKYELMLEKEAKAKQRK